MNPVRFVAALLLLGAPLLAQLTIVTDTVPNAVLGQPYPAVTLETSGAPGPVTWSFVNAPSPPTGFALGRSAGDDKLGTFCYGATTTSTSAPVCSGTVDGFPGIYNFVVRAQSGTSTVDKMFSFVLQSPLRIVTEELPEGSAGEPYSAQLIAAGGAGPFTWQKVGGLLPPEFTITGSGLIAGTAPMIGASYFFVVRLTDTSSMLTVDRAMVINIVGTLRITTTSLPLTRLNQAMTPFQMQAAGGQNFGWSIPPGWTLPAGLTLSSPGELSGTPTVAGTYRILLQVTSALQTEPVAKYLTLYVTLGPLGIAQTDLPVAAAGSLYQATLTPSGGLPPYTWAFDGAVPAGFFIEADTGTIRGIPPSAGSIPLSVAITDATGTRIVKAFTLAVTGPLGIATATLPNATKGAAYSQAVTAAGGQPPYQWFLASGDLPAGLTLTSAGRIEGTPTVEGLFAFEIRVTDFALNSFTRQLSITVVRGVTISTSTLADGITGFAYLQTLTATDAQGAVTWTVAAGTLPAGLALNSATGAIGGTPSAAGASAFTIRATDAGAAIGERAFSITVYAPLTISTASLPGGNRGTAYSQSLAASGGKAPYVWSVSSGTLPAGLQLSAAGAITGTPTAAGASQFQARVADAGTQVATANFSITIIESLTITTTSLPNGSLGTAYSQTLAATGGGAPYTWAITSGTLAGGLQLNASTGAITGTPTATGSFAVTFRVTDQALATASKQLTITITAPALPAVTFTSLPDSSPAARQPSVSVNLASGYAAAVTGTLTLTFASSVGGDDQTVQFSTGSRTLNFTIAAGATLATFTGGTPTVLTGTVAGTITIAAQFSSGGQSVTPSPAPVKTIAVENAPPVISSVTLQRSGNTLTVAVNGYATSREMVSGTYRFSASAGNSLTQSDIAVALTSAFTTWFGGTASNATGGLFRLTVPFTIQGDAAAVNLVSVTLTNARGSSAAVGP